MTIHTPQQLVEKHPDAIAVSLILFLVGFMLGLQPRYAEPIIEKAQKREIDPMAFSTNFRIIVVNNGLIALFSWLGWFTTPIMGFDYSPPAIMVYNIGMAFGAVLGYVSLYQSIITLISFGAMEALGFLFAVAASLLFPKYLLLKLFQKTMTIAETVKDSIALLSYSFVFLIFGAIFETLLINPLTRVVAILGGTVTLFSVLYLVLSE